MAQPDTNPVRVDRVTEPTELPENRFSHALDALIRGVGVVASWVWLLVLVVIVTNVVARYFLDGGTIALEELSWHLYGAGMLLALGYALVTDSHVRVDVLRDHFSLRTQAWIELLGLTLLLLPVLYIAISDMVPYAYRSFIYDERSQAPAGLPYRWILKGLMPTAFALLGVAAISRLTKCTTLLFGWPRQRASAPSSPPAQDR